MEEDEGSVLVGAFSITLLNVEEFLKELGPFAISKYDILAAQEQFDMVRYQRDIGMMLCKIVNGIYHSMPVRDNVNNPIYADAPACLPQEFVKLRNQDFTNLLNTQRTRLSFSKSPHEIALLEDEFVLLRNCYRVTQVALKTAIDALPADATFLASWSLPLLDGRFDRLKDFAGGLASPFPTTATVESDFSIVQWETDAARSQMEHYSLEGIMQCKEHERLKAVVFGKKRNN